MSHYPHPDDPAEPTEQPIRARVPEHVSAGAFSTGVIVMTANSEFILDFVQNLGRPHQIVARVVMPHYVLPQLVDALQRNIELYRGRWGELPQVSLPAPGQVPWSSSGVQAPASQEKQQQAPAEPGSSPQDAARSGIAGGDPGAASGESSQAASPQPANEPAGRQTTAQDIYDDLKIRDELLSGAYANAVMIGHGPHEFSFDFITNFYPHSSVSARVFLAAGQVPRLYDSLKGTWDQLRARARPGGQRSPQQPPGGSGPQQSDPNQSDPDDKRDDDRIV